MACYLIAAGPLSPGSPVKIGVAANPKARLSHLQTAHYETLTLIKVWPGDLAEETAMHQAFSEFHIRGEFYRFSPAMLEVDPAALLASSARPRFAVSPNPDPILNDVERFLATSKMTATAFGRLVSKDPCLVTDLRRGRECRRSVRTRIMAVIGAA